MADVEYQHVSGLKELHRQLQFFETKQAQNILRTALRQAAKPMQQKAASGAPYDPDNSRNDYHLRDAIKFRSAPKRRRTSAVTLWLGPLRETDEDPDAEYKIIGGLAKGPKSPNYAMLAEDKQPYLRPAFDAEAMPTVHRFITLAWKRIERELKKLAQ